MVGEDVASVAGDPRARAVLAPDEAARAERFRAPADPDGFVVGRVLARVLLAEALGLAPAEVPLRVDDRGRPHLAGAPLGRGPGDGPAFSLTHTRGLVGCALALRGEVGLDAEHTGRDTDVDRLAVRYFAPSERRFLDGLSPGERRRGFFAVWTLKEAYLKARGEGISVALSSFAFDPSTSPPGFSCDAGLEADPGAWGFRWAPLGADHVMAWALRGTGGDAIPGAPERVAAAGLLARLPR